MRVRCDEWMNVVRSGYDYNVWSLESGQKMNGTSIGAIMAMAQQNEINTQVIPCVSVDRYQAGSASINMSCLHSNNIRTRDGVAAFTAIHRLHTRLHPWMIGLLSTHEALLHSAFIITTTPYHAIVRFHHPGWTQSYLSCHPILSVRMCTGICE